MKQVCLQTLAKKTDKVAEDWTAGGNEFQITDAATGNQRRPTVVIKTVYMPERATVGMQMSADSGDQEGRRHEPADPGMAVPDHVVHETPSQRL